MIETPIEMITDRSSLQALGKDWAAHEVLACDTEFERSRTFHARPALLQVSDGTACWLIDPLAIDDLDPFYRPLVDPQVEKVFHSGSEDMQMLARMASDRPRNIFDTQIAAGLAGLGGSLSYQDLAREICGVELSKSQTRSNWLQRPLSEAQVHYAALDVLHLIEMRGALRARLVELGRLDWLREDCERMVADSIGGADPEVLFQRFKLAWRLDGPSLAVLRALIEWREDQAAIRDLPRRHVLDDDTLLEIARTRPRDRQAMTEATRTNRRSTTNMSDDLVALVARVEAQGADGHPSPPPAPLDREARKQLAVLRDVVNQAVADTGIDPGMLVNKKELEALVRGEGLSPRLEGWRRDIIGKPLLETLS